MALVTPPKHDLSTRDNKENGPTQLDTPSSQPGSRQRVIFSAKNQEHFFPPLLAANPTPDPTQEPSKSILKKRTYQEFLSDDLFPPERAQRASTPEPENAADSPTYLLSPIKTLVNSVQPGSFDDVSDHHYDLRDLIEAYCILSARIRANLLSTEKSDDANEKTLLPALEPLKQYLEEITDALRRDISRAREDPIQSLAKSAGAKPAELSLPSPPPSSPSTQSSIDSSPAISSQKSDGTPKKGGMNEQQVKHARDLCTLAQSAIKCFSTILCFIGPIHANLLFTDSQLSSLVAAVLAIPLASPLPTPNSRKTCALAVGVVNSFSTLPLAAVSPHCDDIATVYRRGISGELGREGKKGSTGDALRGVVLYTISNPQQFAHPFGVLLPPILKVLDGPAGNMQSQAGFALAGLAYASTETVTPIPGISEVLSGYLTIKQKQKNVTADLPPLFVTVTKYFQSAIVTGSADTTKDSKTTPAMQAACQTTAMWALTVLSSIIVLADKTIFKDQLTTNAVAKIMRVLLASKRVGVRTAASWGWRSFVWTCMREFNELDIERQDERLAMVRRTFDFLEKGVATALFCSLMVGSDGREDRDMRIDLTVEILLDISRKRGLAEEAVRILCQLLGDENFVGGSGLSIGWDLNKLLPACLFDGSLAEADGKTLHSLIEAQKEAEKDWAEDVPPLTRGEITDRLEDMFEVWQNSVRAFGVDDKGYPTPFISETWELLLKRTSLLPEARVLGFVTDPPDSWTNLAQPGPSRTQQIAHQVVQARYIRMLWLGLIKRFGTSKGMRGLALQIYDHALSTFDLNEGKVEDVCLEMFYFLAEVECSIIVLMMGHEEWSAEMKHTFWTKACKAAHDEDLLRALCVVPFGEPAPFELGDEDWGVWEDAWKKYKDTRLSSRGRVTLLSSFCEELGSNLAPHVSARVAGHILEALPEPLPEADLKVVLSFINQSFSLTYESGIRGAIESAITNLRSITDILPHLEPSSLLYVSPSLIQWTSDEEGIMDDREYDIIIGQTYAAVLQCIAREQPVTLETLETHSELLSCVTKRITPGLKTVTTFQRFWTEYCSEYTLEDVPQEMCALLTVMSSCSPQEDPEEEDVEEEQVVEREASSDDSTSSSDEVVSILANAEALEFDVSSTSDIYPTLEEQESEEYDLSSSSAAEGPSTSHRQPSPTPSAPTAAPSTQQQNLAGPSGLSLHAHLEALDLGAPSAQNPFKLKPVGLLFGASPSASPRSKKRRSPDEEECTPVKRRRQESSSSSNDDSDEEEVDDRTPVKPWFGDAELEGKTEEAAIIPFAPFTKHNLPIGAYRFSGEANSKIPPRTTVPVHRSLGGQVSVADIFRPLFVETAVAEQGNPSSKRRRVGGPEPSLSSEEIPYSDDALPPSDPPARLEAESDDSVASGSFSPGAIVSPPMAPAEPGSDDSNESPLKAMLERKKRSMESRMRMEGSSSSDNTQPSTGRQVLVDQEARNAMTRASSLFSSMDKMSLLQMSTLLDQMRTKVEDELRRKSDC